MFATTRDTRDVTIQRENMTAGVPEHARTFRKYHAAATQDKLMQIDGISVTWKRRGEEAWFPYSLRVFGTVVKKDGTLGLVAGQRDYIDYGDTTGINPEAWLLAEIALYAPTGDAW